jgi:hypothetical protein
MENEPFIIEDSLNTSYISTLLFALYYNESIITNTLENIMKTGESLYLQQYIKLRFVTPIKKSQTVEKSIINNIRNILFLNKWKTIDQWLKKHNITDLYCYLINLFNEHQIIINDLNINLKYSVYYLSYDCKLFKTKTKLLNTTDIFNSLMKDKQILNNINIIPIYIKNKKNESIEINKKITVNKTKYYFHSAICINKNGGYYSFINKKDNYYLFDSMRIPCMILLKNNDKNNYSIIEQIKKEVVFIIFIRK